MRITRHLKTEITDVSMRTDLSLPVCGVLLSLFLVGHASADEPSSSANGAPEASAGCRDVVPAEDWAGAGCRGDCLNAASIDIARKQPAPDVPGVDAQPERPEVTVPADVVKGSELPPCFEADYPSSAPSRYSRFLE